MEKFLSFMKRFAIAALWVGSLIAIFYEDYGPALANLLILILFELYEISEKIKSK